MTIQPNEKIPGSDVEVGIYQEIEPLPNFQDPANPWLRKTDWCCDRIIANED